jgi:hypothetical protein
MDQLLAIARPAVAEHGLTGTVVKKALREANTPIGSARFTELMQRLKDEQAATRATTMPGAEPEPARAHPAET